MDAPGAPFLDGQQQEKLADLRREKRNSVDEPARPWYLRGQ
jgi:hypothetical protein